MNKPLITEQDHPESNLPSQQVSSSSQNNRLIPDRESDLLRTFTLLSFITITLISLVGALILTNIVTKRMLHEEARVTQQYIQSAVGTERLPDRPYQEDFLNNKRWLAGYLQRIGRLPNTPLVKIYSPDMDVVWATDPNLIGLSFTDNPELARAFNGDLIFKQEDINELNDANDKTDLAYFANSLDQVIEIYIPLFNSDQSKVVAVVELYKTPDELFHSLYEIKLFIWSGALIAGSILFIVLFSIVRKASKTMKRQRQAIVESEALDTIGEMTSAMAHGIRNPLASIRSSAELALLSPTSAEKMSENIILSVDRLQEWIGEFIQFTESESRFDNQVVVFDRLVEESLQLISEQANRQSIVIELLPFETYAPVSGDPALLRQLLGIILDNCLEAMPDGGIITVRQQNHDKHHLRLDIADNGIGISQEQIKNVFRPFSSNKKHALGLGLMMAQRIAMHHSGHIDLISQEGEGTTVSVILPTVSSQRAKILVIDDEHTFATNLKTYLEQYEFVVELTETASEGLARVASWQPDIVLTEVRISDMDGVSLCQEILKRYARTTIIALTGQANDKRGQKHDLITRLQAVGVRNVMTKPLPLADIRTALEQAKSTSQFTSQK
ncbi:ATP-binding protein [uncultured Amphritea sp.]|uniref:ATP-binding protein n=1 Tax=uncultured Amphritea sp. TaxID=981605 RepID=UPI002608E2A2|nr:ATP-binding protein [uncultured Amphritea sp.]